MPPDAGRNKHCPGAVHTADIINGSTYAHIDATPRKAYIWASIRITILGMQGKQVKLGLEVPDDTTIYREEVYKRVVEENRRALETSNNDLMVAAELWHEA